MKLSDDEQYAVVSALRLAGQKYTENARELRKTYEANPQDSIQRLAAQFDHQAKEARRLAEVIEDAEAVECQQ